MSDTPDIGEHAGLRRGLIAATLLVVTIMLVLPLLVVFTQALSRGLSFLLNALADPDTLASIRLTLLVAAIAVPLNTVLGLAAAWCLVHFSFPGKTLLVALIELPFAVSPVVAGLLYVLLFGARGWFGPFLTAHGIKIIFALPGIILATIFVTLPFVARQIMPLMAALGVDEEEAALMLGARFRHILLHVTLPKIRWALLTGVLLCNARAMGEFGAVAVVSGRIRGLTNTMPLQIESLYDDYNISAAFAVASLLAGLACLTILLRRLLEWQSQLRTERGTRAVLVHP
jgi:sulfate transport system permease protein